jgi:hypothetical protein
MFLGVLGCFWVNLWTAILVSFNFSKSRITNVVAWKCNCHVLRFTNQNVDIKFSAHDTFLEKHSSGTLKIRRLESQAISSFGSNKTKGR